MATRAEWVGRVAAWRASGQTARDFCREKGFSASSVFLWSSRLNGESGRADAPVRLARVVRPPSVHRNAEIVVERGELHVRLSEEAPTHVLESVINLLQRTAS